MEQDGETQATAEIMAGADTPSTSANGSGADAAASSLPNPAILIGAALVGGFLVAQIVRRIRG
jgi:hypothetical protein